MSNPDWTEAPDQATHYDCIADVFCTVDGWWHKNQYVPVENKDWGTDRYTPRPVESATTTWDGTGLPPVGMECEAVILANKPRTVCFVGIKSSGSVVIEGVDGEMKSYQRSQVDFRPIRNQAQIERGRAIIIATRVLNHVDVLTERHAAEALYDAGMLKLPEGYRIER
jgi:hypothetical protein